MNLLAKQQLFSQLVARLIWEIRDHGFDITLGEAWRAPEMAALYAKEGKGIRSSLHTMRLAIDLNLFRDGKFLTEAADYSLAGALWKSYSTPEYECVWGGEFMDDKGRPKPDADHFSLEHLGVR